MESILLFEHSKKIPHKLVAHNINGRVVIPKKECRIEAGLVEVYDEVLIDGSWFVYGDNISRRRIGSAEELAKAFPGMQIYMAECGIPFVRKDENSSIGTFLVDGCEVTANTNYSARPYVKKGRKYA